MPGSEEGLYKVYDVGDDDPKRLDVDFNSDGGGATVQRVGGSTGSGLFADSITMPLQKLQI